MTIQEVDLQLVLGRLRPTSAYHWKGQSDFGNTLEAIGEWRDPNTQRPTEAEILTEWEVYIQEQTARNTLRQQVRNNIAAAVGTSVADLNAAQVKSLLAVWLYSIGAIDSSGRVKPIREWSIDLDER